MTVGLLDSWCTPLFKGAVWQFEAERRLASTNSEQFCACCCRPFDLHYLLQTLPTFSVAGICFQLIFMMCLSFLYSVAFRVFPPLQLLPGKLRSAPFVLVAPAAHHASFPNESCYKRFSGRRSNKFRFLLYVVESFIFFFPLLKTCHVNCAFSALVFRFPRLRFKLLTVAHGVNFPAQMW